MAGHYRAVAVASVLCLGAHAGWGGDRMPGGDSSDSTASNDMVAGWHNYSCTGTFAYQSNSPEEVCDELGIKSYALENEHFAICRWCSDLNPPPPPPGPIIVLPPCPLGSHGHGWQCHANHVCEAVRSVAARQTVRTAATTVHRTLRGPLASATKATTISTAMATVP